MMESYGYSGATEQTESWSPRILEWFYEIINLGLLFVDNENV